jgi:putative phosphoesterase
MVGFMQQGIRIRQAEEHVDDAPNAPERIGVIADTHNVLPSTVEECWGEIDEIWHLGDVCEPWILDALQAICDRVIAVRGNNDWNVPLPLSIELRRGRELFYLTHILPNRPLHEYDWVLYGHTHIPDLNVDGQPKYLNPGAVGRCNRGAPPSVALLKLSENGHYQAELIRLP